MSPALATHKYGTSEDILAAARDLAQKLIRGHVGGRTRDKLLAFAVVILDEQNGSELREPTERELALIALLQSFTAMAAQQRDYINKLRSDLGIE